MQEILSTANEKVKAVKRLSQKKYRDESGLYVAEGAIILSDMPDEVNVRQLFFTKDFDGAEGLQKRYPSAETYAVSAEVMKSMCETVTPQGVLAVIAKPASKPIKSNALVLDGVADSGNLGTIIRTAVGADYLNVYLIGCADVYSGKTVRASMGGVFRANFFETSYEMLEKQLSGYQKISMDMSGENLFDYVPQGKPVALFFGNEGHGLSDFSKNLADLTLSLPMANGQESLNVAVAAGISMYVINNKINLK